MSKQDADGTARARVIALARETKKAIPRAIDACAERENVQGRPPKVEAPERRGWPLAKGVLLLAGGQIYLEDDENGRLSHGRLLRADQLAGWALEALREDAYQSDDPEPQVVKSLEAWLGAIHRLIDSTPQLPG